MAAQLHRKPEYSADIKSVSRIPILALVYFFIFLLFLMNNSLMLKCWTQREAKLETFLNYCYQLFSISPPSNALKEWKACTHFSFCTVMPTRFHMIVQTQSFFGCFFSAWPALTSSHLSLLLLANTLDSAAELALHNPDWWTLRKNKNQHIFSQILDSVIL